MRILLESVENFNGVRSIGNRFRALISTGMMRPSWKERVGDALALGGEEGSARPVAYTHQTLPTKKRMNLSTDPLVYTKQDRDS